MRALMFFCIAVFVVIQAGCSSKVCEPRAVGPCTCQEGARGFKTCNNEGTAWGDCACNPFDNLPIEELPTPEEIERLRRELEGDAGS